MHGRNKEATRPITTRPKCLGDGRRRAAPEVAYTDRVRLISDLAGGKSSAKALPFIGLGRSGKQDIARKAESILARELGGKRKTGAKRRNR